MKNIFFAIALLISFVSFGQEDIKQGLVIKYYKSGEVEYKLNYVDGTQQGESIGYYKSGEIKEKGNYVDGKIQGEFIMYYENGEIKEKGNYVDGKIQGEGITNYESYENLIKSYDNAISLNPTSSKYYYRGMAKYNLEDYEGAIKDYSKSLEINGGVDTLDTKTLADCYWKRASSYIQLSSLTDTNDFRLPLAINDYNKFIEIMPNNGTAYYSRGMVKYRHLGGFAACEDFKKAVELGSDYDAEAKELIDLYCN